MKTVITHLITLLIGGAVAYALISSKDSAPSSVKAPLQKTPSSSAQTASNPSPRKTNSEDFSQNTPPSNRQEELTTEAQNLPKLNKEELENYLKTRGRHPHSLLQVALNTGDISFFTEALQAAPNDPLLLFYAAQENELKIPLSKRIRYSEKLIEVDPHNSNAYYLHAANLTKVGDLSQATTVITSMPPETALNNYQNVILAETLDLQEATGRSTEFSKISSFYALPATNTEFLQLSNSLNTHANTLPVDEANTLRSSLITMGDQLHHAPSNLVENLLGIAVSTTAVESLPPEAPSAYVGMTNAQALEYLRAEIEQVKQVNSQVNLPELMLTNPELVSRMLDRQMIMGEREALQWVAGQLENLEE